MCEHGTYKEVLVKTYPDNIYKYKKVDSCIADIVDALNRYGLETTTSCCGHGSGESSILLEDGRQLFIV